MDSAFVHSSPKSFLSDLNDIKNPDNYKPIPANKTAMKIHAYFCRIPPEKYLLIPYFQL